MRRYKRRPALRVASVLDVRVAAWKGWSGEEMGVSAFLRLERGIDLLNGTYNWLDLTARGRQEDWEQPAGRGDPALGWVRRRDEYEPAGS